MLLAGQTHQPKRHICKWMDGKISDKKIIIKLQLSRQMERVSDDRLSKYLTLIPQQ